MNTQDGPLDHALLLHTRAVISSGQAGIHSHSLLKEGRLKKEGRKKEEEDGPGIIQYLPPAIRQDVTRALLSNSQL